MSTPTNGTPSQFKYPGKPVAIDGSTAIVEMETAASDAAGAYPITPSTQMGEGWAAAVGAGQTNVFGRRLLFFEPEGEHAAAAVTAGMNLIGLRSTNFSSGQGIAYMHESLYPAVGKRLTYVLNMACRAMTKHTLNVHAGHDDYHAVDDSGFFQIFAKNVTESADLNLICHRIAELSLNPGICALDGFLTSHSIESALLPERDLVREYLGDPADLIDAPTAAQKLVFGEQRRRIPELYNLDYPSMLGVVQNQDSYAQGVAAQRPFYFDHIEALTDQAMAEYGALTGRHYTRVMGYRLDDAEYVIAGQGSLTENAEAVIDHLRERGLKVGVLNLTMFRPFPSDLISSVLCGKKGVAVLERLDQPLAVDAPILREIRAAMGKAVENGRAGDVQSLPYPGIKPLRADQVPDFYSGSFGMGSRDLQPNDLIAAVENMLDGGAKLRQFYLSIDFVRKNTRLPKLQIWQDQLLEAYPHLETLALDPSEPVNLMPDDTTSIRVHSIGGWGAITMGKNLAVTAAELLGLNMKANPKYGSEKKGQPTTFYASLSKELIRLNCELTKVDVVLSPDPNVFRHSNPLSGMSQGGIFIIQSELGAQEFWDTIPNMMQQQVRSLGLQVYFVDAFKIAAEEASNDDLRYRMQGTAFMGAFFHAAPMVKQAGLQSEEFLGAMHKQLQKKFGHLGDRVVEDNLRVIRRGYEQLQKLDLDVIEDGGAEAGQPAHIPEQMNVLAAEPGMGNAGRFWEQVGHLYQTGEEGLADPFAATSTIPAVTSSMRDMTDVRFEVPSFIAENCTGCSQCWTQCPDTAIPGLVTSVEDVIQKAIDQAKLAHAIDRLQTVVKPVARETRKLMKGAPFTTFGAVLSTAFENVLTKMAPEPERRAQLEQEYAAIYGIVADFPLAKTGAFFDGPENQEKGAGALLSITINPETCKGCNICVDVCPDGALETIKQTDEIVDTLRRNWEFWKTLPETDDRYVKIASMAEGIGVLPSLLLKKENYLSMAGGDGACLGCGEKTVLHLVIAAVYALILPRVEQRVAKLDQLIAGLDAKARAMVSSDLELEVLTSDSDQIDIPLDRSKQNDIQRISGMIRELKDLRWRYVEGPSGLGRSNLGMTNSTGCSSVWASTYPYNPYPFPWVNHLFQDAPSVAVGIFEGHMRKMADDFITVRRADLELKGNYQAEVHEAEFATFNWEQFDDEEFELCPPILAVGGDGAMMDIGFQNLSRLMASGKPIRVVVLDTQVYSNTGGQACTSGFTGQVSDMATFGKAQPGKVEIRKELSLITMAHRRVYLVQSSQATASHLMGGVLRGLQSRHPAVFLLHAPCPPEHGIADDSATRSSRMALESRAFPAIEFNPDGGPHFADCLSLIGNPELDELWPSYELSYLDDDHQEQVMELPMTTADWAATEGRFKKQFRPAPKDADNLVPFADFLQMSTEDRVGNLPFIYVLDAERHLRQMLVSDAIVQLAEDRQILWTQLKEMAGLEINSDARAEVEAELESEFDQRIASLKAEYEQRIHDLHTQYPVLIARRLAEGLLRTGDGNQTVSEVLAKAQESKGLTPLSLDGLDAAALFGITSNGTATAPTSTAAPAASGTADQASANLAGNANPNRGAGESPAATAVAAPSKPDDNDDDFGVEAYIDSELCTTCNECTNLNKKMFVYNELKQAVIKDASAGTFQQLVMAAEACPVSIIHPGTPLNPKEKGLDKWLKRAEPFN
jgi:pyruvate-ferredoxin/flavodoxin oxidoreductase